MATRFRADRNDKIATGFFVLDGVLDLARQCRDADALFVGHFNQVTGWRAQRADDQLDRMFQRAVNHRQAFAWCEILVIDGVKNQALFLAFGQAWNAGVVEQFREEIDLFAGQQAIEVVLARAGIFDHGRHEHIDAVGLAADVAVEPVEFFVQLGRADARQAKYTHAASLGYLGGTVAAMRERQDGRLDAEHLANSVFHVVPDMHWLRWQPIKNLILDSE